MKTVGIIGGMGPMATCDLFKRIIALTDAKCDGEHLHILIDNNPSIPDRSAALVAGGPSPVPEIRRGAKRLVAAGAELLAMPCNTSHSFLSEIREGLGVPFIDMTAETAAELKRLNVKKAGILGTDGLLASGVYSAALKAAGIEPLVPPPELQGQVMGIIYDGVKAGDARYDPRGFREAMDCLLGLGAQRLILACTELPLVFEMYGVERPPLTDATEVLARVVILQAGGKIKAI